MSALTYAERIAQIAEHIANHSVHGYSQNNRAGDGTTETVTLSDGSKVILHGGDYDCSEMVRTCVNCAISGSYKSPITYMWTGTENDLLIANGFKRTPFATSSVKRGDVLFIKGHTGIALGGGKQADAHGDEYGGITGPNRGDQTGHEIEVRSLRTNWTYIYRKEGGGVAYSNSSLINGTLRTNNHSGTRTHAIDTITPHYMAWYTSAKTCCQSFVPSSRQASANYCIGKDGEIWLNVDEKNRAWTTGSAANDQRAVTIECANYTDAGNGHVLGQLPDATWKSLVALCADICKRNGKTRLLYRGRADYSNMKSTDMLLTMHKWFQATDCPGPWLSYKFELLANQVNALLAPQKPGDAANNLGLHYRAHVQSVGWLAAVHDGQVAGTTGMGLRLEALKITPPDGVELEVLAHIQGVGDKVYRGIRKGKSSGTGSSSNDPIIGTVGKGKRIEGIRIDVARNDGKCKGKTLYYRVHVQKRGWTAWTKQGKYAGTRGKGLRVEAIQMKFE